ncbi:hypothetical protein M409DRAFT_37739 [Zasmidium cellare ATCC 36951]|uniref:AB hydrolase-1 domain-containing protein n=1 Tax=Zasmidium cellare ATCC 36951 TaxID=1080233 RepID=A0A6A6C4R1_ZASCE|nr:uncharacterized protein M409DRAFT_37739 [Zasmidium cellare ATCC 36951]KAF2160366.1 hypothetical protein M409DRAFT_37739 [Zasmidium cellare ATCC 36951]
MQNIKLSDGCNVKAKILNPEDKAKNLLLACHGAPGLSNHGETELWCSPYTDLFRVLVFDLRGCGHSDQQGPYTHERWSADLDELRQWAGDEKVVFIGASHGGFLGLEYALRYPQHVSALIIGDTAAQFSHGCMLEAYKTALTDPRSKDVVDPDQLMRLFTGTTTSFEDHMGVFAAISPLYAVPDHLASQAEASVGEALSKIIIPIPETNRAAHDYCLSRFDVRDRLHEIRVPTFVFSGRFDWICPPKYTQAIADGIPGAKFVVYEASGHLPAIEEKTKFEKDLREFLKGARIPGLDV